MQTMAVAAAAPVVAAVESFAATFYFKYILQIGKAMEKDKSYEWMDNYFNGYAHVLEGLPMDPLMGNDRDYAAGYEYGMKGRKLLELQARGTNFSNINKRF